MITLGIKTAFTMTNRSLLPFGYLKSKQRLSEKYFHYYHFSGSDSLEFLRGRTDE